MTARPDIAGAYARPVFGAARGNGLAGAALAPIGAARVPGATIAALALWCAALLPAPAAQALAPARPDAAPAPAQRATVRDSNAVGVDELLRSARLWQALGHPQSERAILVKILAIDGAQARALLLLGELELRQGNLDEGSRVLNLMRSRLPGSAATGQMQELLRVYRVEQNGRGGLGELRLAVRGGNTARALALAHALFPSGRPPGDLANEFAPLLASTPAGWENMRALFAARVAADPNPLDRLSLYELLAQHADTREQALRGYADLSHSHDAPPERVAQAWRHALLALADDAPALAQRRRFLQRFPADAQMRAAVAQNEARLGERSGPDAVAPDDPGVQARQAAVRALDAGAWDEAEAQLQRSLALRADDGETVGTLGLLRLRQGRHDEALQQFESAQSLEPPGAGSRARWRDLAATARYWAAVGQARTLRAAGDLEGAARTLIAVQDTQPDQTQARLLLAEVRAQQGRDAEAEALYRALLARDLGDAPAWRGLLSLQLQHGQVDAALDQAQELPLRANVAPLDALDPGALRDAIGRVGAGHPDVALRLLERAVGLLPADPWLRYDLAQQYRRLGLPELARQVMREGQALAPRDASMNYAGALVDAATDHEDVALATVEAIDPQARTEGMRSLAQRLRFERALRSARTARGDGRADDDARARAQALAEAGDDPARQLRVARADLSADDTAAARALLDALAARADTLPMEQQRDLARALIDAGEPAAALTLLDRLLAPGPAAGVPAAGTEASGTAGLLLLRARAHQAQGDLAAVHADIARAEAQLPPGDVAQHLEMLRLLDADRPQARARIAELLAGHPQDPDVLLEAARQAREDRQYERAVALLRQVEALPQADTPGAAPSVPLLALQGAANSAAGAGVAPADDSAGGRAREQRAAIEARRQAHIDIGWLGYKRSATDGVSTLRGTEIPLLGVWPQGYDGHWFAQLDAVRLDAGTLAPDIATAQQLGTVLALAPAGLPAPVAQSASGLSIAGGWRGDERRVDLGLVGAGFKVPNVVGGWRESAQWGATDVSAELARRVLTGSLLSYAGAADPVTGASWGGAVQTALGLRAGRDFGERWSGSTSLTAGLVTGRSLPSNAMVQWRNVLERDWIRRRDWRLSGGAVFSLWHYASNESFYTFGQGGYYSPQRYVSLGMPIEIEGRRGALSYDLRATPSYSWTNEQDTPYYPGRPDLQALAGNPMHTAGTGGGLAGSLRAALEYRIDPHWSAGAWLDIDRSAYYAPTQAMVYLRYAFPQQLGPVDFPPRRVVPISQY